MAGPFNQTIFNQSGNTRGTWFPIHNVNVPFSLTVEGISGDTIQIRVSNRTWDDPPTTDEQQYGADITVNGKVEITAPFGWIAIKKTVGASTVVVKTGGQYMLG